MDPVLKIKCINLKSSNLDTFVDPTATTIPSYLQSTVDLQLQTLILTMCNADICVVENGHNLLFESFIENKENCTERHGVVFNHKTVKIVSSWTTGDIPRISIIFNKINYIICIDKHQSVNNHHKISTIIDNLRLLNPNQNVIFVCKYLAPGLKLPDSKIDIVEQSDTTIVFKSYDNSKMKSDADGIYISAQSDNTKYWVCAIVGVAIVVAVIAYIKS